MVLDHERLPDDPATRAGLGIAAAGVTGVGSGWLANRFTDIGQGRGVIPQATGLATGVGTPLVLRRTVDVREDGSPRTLIGDPDTLVGRVWRPSAAAGIWGGSLAGLVWAADTKGGLDMLSDNVRDFLFWGAVTGVPVGLGSALFPKEMGGNSNGSNGGSPQASRSLGNSRSRKSSSGEFGAAN